MEIQIFISVLRDYNYMYCIYICVLAGISVDFIHWMFIA
jgi:hypothetical protein